MNSDKDRYIVLRNTLRRLFLRQRKKSSTKITKIGHPYLFPALVHAYHMGWVKVFATSVEYKPRLEFVLTDEGKRLLEEWNP